MTADLRCAGDGTYLVGPQVLATAASNMAVDNLVERIVRGNSKLMVVRVGHPARLLPQVGPHQPSKSLMQ